MADLIAKPALGALPSVTLAGTELAQLALNPLTSVAPYPGRLAQVNAALAPLGLTFPAPNSQNVTGAARLVWTGREQAFLIGAAAPAGLSDHAALTDQSDGWAALGLSGPAAVDALARLVPLDLREQAFPPGQVCRAALGHLSMILTRSGPQAFEILVFRSMARTAWHELGDALERVAARASLT